MAEEEGSPGADVVDVFVIVGVEEVGSFAAGNEAGGASYSSPSADGGVDASGDGELGSFEEFLRLGCVH
jgi:hypothetical protein